MSSEKIRKYFEDNDEEDFWGNSKENDNLDKTNSSLLAEDNTSEDKYTAQRFVEDIKNISDETNKQQDASEPIENYIEGVRYEDCSEGLTSESLVIRMLGDRITQQKDPETEKNKANERLNALNQAVLDSRNKKEKENRVNAWSEQEPEKQFSDEYLQAYEENLYREGKMRELGMPKDEDFKTEYIDNRMLKIVSGISIASSLLIPNDKITLALMSFGIIAFAGAKIIENQSDLKYREAVHSVRVEYIKGRGSMTDEEARFILNTNKKLPIDEYALASMPKEEREQIINSNQNPKQLSKRKLTKHIKKELLRYQMNQNKKNKTYQSYER